jgi:hypothetical protein
VTRTSTIVTLAILSSILTPVVVKATGATQQPAVVQEAKVEVAAAIAPEASPCVRRVKVVHAGFAEVHAAACAATAELRR